VCRSPLATAPRLRCQYQPGGHPARTQPIPLRMSSAVAHRVSIRRLWPSLQPNCVMNSRGLIQRPGAEDLARSGGNYRICALADHVQKRCMTFASSRLLRTALVVVSVACCSRYLRADFNRGGKVDLRPISAVVRRGDVSVRMRAGRSARLIDRRVV
jgi:hypothetical protein